jgi:hypothetical protein
MGGTLVPGSDGEGRRVGGGGREAAQGQGKSVRENCQSWGASSSPQPMRMAWPSGWRSVTVALSKIILHLGWQKAPNL